MYKPLADSTLQRMKKTEIIELLRIAEHNVNVAQEYVDQQAENIKDWSPVRHGRWIERKSLHAESGIIAKCSVCQKDVQYLGNPLNFCPNCGAKMDGGDGGDGDAAD